MRSLRALRNTCGFFGACGMAGFFSATGIDPRHWYMYVIGILLTFGTWLGFFKLSRKSTKKREMEDKLLSAALRFYDNQGIEDLRALDGTQSMDAPVEYMDFLYCCKELKEQ